MSNKLTDTQLIEAIEHVFATVHDDSDAIAKVRRLLAPPAMLEKGLHPDYDFAAASESERWHFDMGYESGWDARLNPETMELTEFLDELVEAMQAMAEKLERPQPTRGRIEFEGASIDLPDERPSGTAMDMHDDPEQQP